MIELPEPSDPTEPGGDRPRPYRALLHWLAATLVTSGAQLVQGGGAIEVTLGVLLGATGWVTATGGAAVVAARYDADRRQSFSCRFASRPLAGAHALAFGAALGRHGAGVALVIGPATDVTLPAALGLRRHPPGTN
ncbi:hypothetical protein CFP65_1581 [Kitasatospora sp. MMS16-BH015]|uniref:hypothetical protein n=1 Tax=Kitasatospora sp. MMS16-BH015 TaxID=2018025 RepID=UPI000CA1A2A1|nr:hypothetical protein [Kitasatospora sp. MMS16-BH015]AUG76469.1 hypothetical protein CFP65_1581 [Kitasatospora sp. MMS16-BH015]